MSAAIHCWIYAGQYQPISLLNHVAIYLLHSHQVAFSPLSALLCPFLEIWCSVCSRLLALHRTSVLRHDEYGQETLVNLLLRNYLHYNLYDQVSWLHNKSTQCYILPLTISVILCVVTLLIKCPIVFPSAHAVQCGQKNKSQQSC